MTGLVWHYTVLCRGFMILRDGHIRPSEVAVGPDEVPVVWFTASPVRDPTVSDQGDRAYIQSVFGPHALEPVRIGVRREITFPFARHAMPEAVRTALVRVGRQRGANPRDWHCHSGFVAASSFATVEHDDGRHWQSVTLTDLMKLVPGPARGLTVRVNPATGQGDFVQRAGLNGVES